MNNKQILYQFKLTQRATRFQKQATRKADHPRDFLKDMYEGRLPE